MKDDLKWLRGTLDCGDNSCIYQDQNSPGGMRTNGGCRCFKDLEQKKRTYIHKIFNSLNRRCGACKHWLNRGGGWGICVEKEGSVGNMMKENNGCLLDFERQK